MIKKQRHEKLDGRKVGNKIAMEVSDLTSKAKISIYSSTTEINVLFF